MIHKKFDLEEASSYYQYSNGKKNFFEGKNEHSEYQGSKKFHADEENFDNSSHV
jgi:hypothetical protein